MINMYMHGGSENHGCEAIIRSTIKILNQSANVYSNNINQDIKYGLNKICNLENAVPLPIVRGSREWFFSSLQTKLTGKIDLSIKYRYKDFYKTITRGDIFLSVGGDNYCYAGTDVLAAKNYNLRKKKCRTVLWGCSIEPELLYNKEIKEDIERFDLITARESISYEALIKVNTNTYLVSDPAFVLDIIKLPVPEGWQENNMVGINVSPLILSSSNNKELVLEAYDKLIIQILDATDFGVALIPHVVWEKNDDRSILKLLYNKFKHTGRIILLDDYNCMELKGYIARCRFFVGARTHATIAAYSSCVPTLVLGYSVKSRGIAKDLFGTAENYVLPVQSLDEPKELARHFMWIVEHETEIRKHLEEIMPEYISRAYIGKKALEKLVQ